MPRPRSVPDAALLDAALDIVHRSGPNALSFSALAAATGLAGSTLVQRFASKASLLQATLLHAWDHLDAQTAEVVDGAGPGAEGVIELFVAMTGGVGDDDYADQLPVLREDLRDPLLRARGERWLRTLAAAADDRLPDVPGGVGDLLVAQWQGTLIVWAFTRTGPLADAVRSSLTDLLDRLRATAG